VAIVVAAVLARVAGWAQFQAYPSLVAPADVATIAIGAALVVCALAPFAQRRGIER
jgi:hypothetical protein